MLEANVYKLENIQEFTNNKRHNHPSATQKESITTLLAKHKDLFRGKRGKWKGGDVILRLKQDAKLYLAKPCLVPLLQKEEFKKELYRQYDESPLRKLPPLETERLERGFPIFGMPKKDKK